MRLRVVLRSLPRRLPAPPARRRAAAAQAAAGGGFDRPRVGVSAVVLRRRPGAEGSGAQGAELEVLMIKRGKEPSKGLWCFPGGSLELGETLADCAARECEEETGVLLRRGNGAERLVGCGVGTSFTGSGAGDHKLAPPPLYEPTPFTATDAIYRADDGSVDFHYAVIQLVASPVDETQEPSAADDADAAKWMPVDEMRMASKMLRRCPDVAEEAARQFGGAL